MPNWCLNTLDVSGPRDDLAAFAGLARGCVDGEELALSLHALVPEPAVMPEESDRVEWRRRTWGTKWDITGVHLFQQDRLLTYTFWCPWTPPLPWLRQVAERFPGLTFHLCYAEPGDCFAGEVTCESGVECAVYYTDERGPYEDLVRRNFAGHDLLNEDEDEAEPEESPACRCGRTGPLVLMDGERGVVVAFHDPNARLFTVESRDPAWPHRVRTEKYRIDVDQFLILVKSKYSGWSVVDGGFTPLSAGVTIDRSWREDGHVR